MGLYTLQVLDVPCYLCYVNLFSWMNLCLYTCWLKLCRSSFLSPFNLIRPENWVGLVNDLSVLAHKLWPRPWTNCYDGEMINYLPGILMMVGVGSVYLRFSLCLSHMSSLQYFSHFENKKVCMPYFHVISTLCGCWLGSTVCGIWQTFICGGEIEVGPALAYEMQNCL